jgi:ribonucleoside-diphosphate reductase alpha chain
VAGAQDLHPVLVDVGAVRCEDEAGARGEQRAVEVDRAAVRGHADALAGLARGVHPYDEVTWERATPHHQLEGRQVAFEQLGVEFPTTWSVNATNIVAQKYFRGTLGTPERESSLKQVIDRVADTITDVGRRGRLLRRRGRGRGVPGRAQAPPRHPEGRVQLAGVVQHRRRRACPSRLGLLHPLGRRHDGLDPQLVRRGGHDLQGRLGRRHQPVEDPLLGRSCSRAAAPPPARSASCAAPTPRPARSSRAARPAAPPRWSSSTSTTPTSRSSSGARPRRSEGRVLRDAGFDMDLDGADSPRSSTRTPTTRCASPTSSCRPSSTTPTGTCVPSPRRGVETVRGRDLMRQIAQAAWECADPGMQFDTTINRLAHRARTPAASTARTRARSTCTSTTRRATSPAAQPAEVPRRRRRPVRRRGLQARRRGRVHRPGDPRRPGRLPDRAHRRERSRKFRQLGLGYANLGALLMASACPTTPTRAGRGPGAITALMTGHAYATSPAPRPHGPVRRLRRERGAHAAGARMHRDAAPTSTRSSCPPTCSTRRPAVAWDDAVRARRGVRRAQLAGHGARAHRHHRPDDGLRHHRHRARPRPVKMKKLVGGGTMTIVNQTCPRALRRLGYTPSRSTTSSPTSTRTSRSSARRTSPPSTCRCSPARWATTRSTTRATCG